MRGAPGESELPAQCQQPSVELVALGQFADIYRTLEQGLSLAILQVADAVVGYEAAWILHTVTLQSDGYFRVTIVGIEYIHDTGILVTFTVNDDAFQVNESLVNVVIQHHQREEVVGRTAEVRVQNHLDGFLCLLGN